MIKIECTHPDRNLEYMIIGGLVTTDMSESLGSGGFSLNKSLNVS